MNKNIVSVVAICLIAGIIYSCDEDQISDNANVVVNKTNELAHFVDDVSVSEEVYENESENMFLVEVYKPSTNLKSACDGAEVELRAYSNEQKYIEFGNEYGYNFDKQLLFEQIMSKYALMSGAIEEFEDSGEMPNWYFQREKTVYDSLFTNTSNEKSGFNLFVTLYEDHFVAGAGAGSCVVLINNLPFMYPGWNNRVSCIEFVGLGGALAIYDKSFYRKRLKTVVNLGMTHINLGNGVNDKMSSGLTFF